MRPIPQCAVDFLKEAERLVLFAYDDAHFPPKEQPPGKPIDGTLTAGYGHTGADVYIGMPVSTAKAEYWVGNCDLKTASCKLAAAIGSDVIAALTENQYAALLSFVDNCGTGNPKKPEWNIWKVLRARHFDQVPLELARFVNGEVNGKPVKIKGLVKRRGDEIALWSKDEPGSVDLVLPSSVTRVIETQPTMADPVPVAKSKTFISGAVAAVAAMPVAYSQAAVALHSANLAPSHPSIVASLSGVSAVAAGLSVLFAYLHKQNSKN